MERRPPPASYRRKQIPAGYGNYMGRDDGASSQHHTLSTGIPATAERHSRGRQPSQRMASRSGRHFTEPAGRTIAHSTLSHSATPSTIAAESPRLAAAVAERRASLQGVPARRASPLLSAPERVSQGYTPLLGNALGAHSRLDAQSPFLTAPQQASQRPSPLVKSAVNPFSASFANRLAGRSFSGGKARDGSDQYLLDGRSTQVGQGGGGSIAKGGGYGSRWGGSEMREGDSIGVKGDGVARLNRAWSSGSGEHKVHDHGHSIYYKHGVRLVESAEIRLETLTALATWIVFTLPYM
ncbi:unnamed protein product [Choristocarpus tenellus]